jgi:hypothetical protein
VSKVIVLAFLSFAACRSSNDPGVPPPAPNNAVSYFGHREKYYVPMFSQDDPTWYAYWSETLDGSHAILRAGISESDQDSIFLVHTNPQRANTDSTDWWRYAPNTKDSIIDWQYVRITSDSIISGSHGVDCGTFYYLKKQ